jgi:hypothetical protein
MMNAKPTRRFPWLWYLLALLAILAFAFAPVGAVMLCAAIANAYGCKWMKARCIPALSEDTIMASFFTISV